MLKKLILWVIALRSPEKYRVGALYIQGRKFAKGYNTLSHYGWHAEDMAMKRFKEKYGIEATGGTMYCTYSPCTVCKEKLEKRFINSVYVYKYAGKL